MKITFESDLIRIKDGKCILRGTEYLLSEIFQHVSDGQQLVDIADQHLLPLFNLEELFTDLNEYHSNRCKLCHHLEDDSDPDKIICGWPGPAILPEPPNWCQENNYCRFKLRTFTLDTDKE